ncbi:MAG: hypothetical protein COB75_08495 [Idiomarina sp.]|nr:prepilin-type N-terminal cleavage/methylation domain-containing protein [Idiomarina sp.]PHQ72919.1 MAG: hypothetical protein COB75_08495 [Idiomarina sp.]
MYGNRGFTLIEILIASVILFFTLASATMAYRTSLLSNAKTEKIVEVQIILPLVKDQVSTGLKSRDNLSQSESGRGELNGWTFKWQARRLSYTAPPDRFDPDVGDLISYNPRFHRYNVTLELSTETYSRQLNYEELAWDATAEPKG